MTGPRNRSGLIGSARRGTGRYLGGLWSGHWLRLALACVYAVLLLEFQVRKTPDCLGRHRGLRRFLEKFPVLLHGLIDALLWLRFFHVRSHVMQVCQRALSVGRLMMRSAAAEERRRKYDGNGVAAHQRPPAPDWARAALS